MTQQASVEAHRIINEIEKEAAHILCMILDEESASNNSLDQNPSNDNLDPSKPDGRFYFTKVKGIVRIQQSS